MPKSEGFDDVYYNHKNGLAEKSLVFLEGNNLPAAWLGQAQFTIAETGFGLGMNFLNAWKLFEETARDGERLDFISTEQFPLSAHELRQALQPWEDEIGQGHVARLLEIYPPRFPGFHRRWVTDRVTLTLIFDDALRAFTQLDCQVDAWFLDGFAPKKNGDLWTPGLFREMARLSHDGTTLGSFSAAGDVKRGLKEIGFTIKREKGFGYKYHRITGRFSGKAKQKIARPETVTIIGTGLAGAACAFALRRRGIKTVLWDKNATAGAEASGNKLGLINPRIEVQDNPRNDAGLGAFSFAGHVLQGLAGIDYRRTGALHLFLDAHKKEKLEKIFQRGEWLAPHFEWREDGLFFADSAMVNTRKLVTAMLDGQTVVLNRPVDAASLPDGPVILACGWGLKAFPFLDKLPLQPVRGQVSFVKMPGVELNHPLMAGNYIAPMPEGGFCLGASFEPNNESTELKEEDDRKNVDAGITILNTACAGESGESIRLIESWAQIRTASRDRFPILGQIPGKNELYISGALGSHGIQFSLLHGEILACLLTGGPLPLGRDALNSLSVARFFKDE